MESPGTHKLQLEMLDHIGIRVKDIDKVTETWSLMFGIGSWTFHDIGGIDAKGRSWKARMAFASMGSLGVHIIQPVEGRIFQSRFLDTLGEGLDHLGYYVDDLDGEISNLEAKGAKLLFKDVGNFAYLQTGGVIFQPMKRGYLG